MTGKYLSGINLLRTTSVSMAHHTLLDIAALYESRAGALSGQEKSCEPVRAYYKPLRTLRGEW